jgi:hypothetical protein
VARNSKLRRGAARPLRPYLGGWALIAGSLDGMAGVVRRVESGRAAPHDQRPATFRLRKVEVCLG